MRLLWLPDVLRDAGGKVAVEKGWEVRSRGGDTQQFTELPLAVSWHHTASSASLANQVYQMCYQSPALPIANLAVGVDGTLVVMSANPTNTSGRGRSLKMSRGTIRTDNANRQTLGAEMLNNGVGQPWPAAQIDAMFLASNAINRELGNQPTDAYTHNWYALLDANRPAGRARKIDPATAAAVLGEWRPRDVGNGAGSWVNQDVLDECVRRNLLTLPPQPPSTGDDDEVILYAATDRTGTVWVGDGVTRVAVLSPDEFNLRALRASLGSGPQLKLACGTGVDASMANVGGCRMNDAELRTLGIPDR